MKLKFKIVEEVYDDYKLEQILRDIANKIGSEFEPHIGYSFQGYPLSMFIYDFDKDYFLFPEGIFIKLKIRKEKIYAYKRQPAGNYIKVKTFKKKSKLLSFIKKACNV